MAQYDEDWFRQQQGDLYDPSSVEAFRHATADAGGDPADWAARINAKNELRRDNAPNSTYTSDGKGGFLTSAQMMKQPSAAPSAAPSGPNAATGQAGAPTTSTSFAQQWNTPADAATAADTKSKSDALYARLLADSQQSLTIDPNDPTIRRQADTFSAGVERSKRNSLADLAEKAGPLANLRGETRMANEHAGQASAANEAGLMGAELTARRAAIQDRLHSMQGMLTTEETLQLQQELAKMDNAIKQQQVNAVVSGQSQQNDQFMRDLGLREWDRTNYWNYANTYGL